MLVPKIDTELFDECGKKNYFSHFIKGIAIDFTNVPSQLTRRLSKLLGFNILGMNENNTTELVSIFPMFNFKMI